MRAFGVLLMFSGWLIAVAAIALLHTDYERLMFAACGVSVQCLGLATLIYAHRSITNRSSEV